MKLAILLSEHAWVPTIIMTALCLPHWTIFVLSEIQSLTKVDFTSKWVWEILVRDLAILVDIKCVEQLIKLLFRHPQTPMIDIKPELSLWYPTSWSVFVEIFKCLENGLPLCFDLINHYLFQLFHCSRLLILIEEVSLLVHLANLLFIPRVLYWVMSKVESFTLMNAASNPTAKIFIIDFALSLRVPFTN